MAKSTNYHGYRPILNCCITDKNHWQGSKYLCRFHGWKDSELKPEGEQLKLFIRENPDQ
jgi:hypothetical protein